MSLWGHAFSYLTLRCRIKELLYLYRRNEKREGNNYEVFRDAI